jgi:hypothetical protein
MTALSVSCRNFYSPWPIRSASVTRSIHKPDVNLRTSGQTGLVGKVHEEGI